MMKKLWNSEPVVLVGILLVIVMVVQKLWLGEVITQDWVTWVLGLFTTATGVIVARSQVTPVKKDED
jgi:hypothetical protein